MIRRNKHIELLYYKHPCYNPTLPMKITIIKNNYLQLLEIGYELNMSAMITRTSVEQKECSWPWSQKV